MRNIKELLEVMLNNQQLFKTGLCYWATCLLRNNIHINWNEYCILHSYIKANRPSQYSSFNAFKTRNSLYYWEYKDIAPRIAWIKKHIKKNS